MGLLILVPAAIALAIVGGIQSAHAAGAVRLCPPAATQHAGCDAWFKHSSRAQAADSGPGPGTVSPARLHSAYRLPNNSTRRQTVAVIVADNDPTIAKDLARYSSYFHLPGCTTRSGCLRVVNQDGRRSPLPRFTDGDQAGEAALGLETVHGVCHNCRLLLVEANSNDDGDLAAAVDSAARLGANEISLSYVAVETFTKPYYAPHYSHPGVVIVAASGDTGYEGTSPSFPASLPAVIAAGGTTLKTSSRGGYVSETAWSNSGGASGSGCSTYFAPPAWQRSTAAKAGCGGGRALADVSASAHNAGVYTSTPVPSADNATGWFQVDGTSVSAPLIAGVFALAGGTNRSHSPGATLYAQRRYLHDVTRGSNGSCGSKPICRAGRGYDGPTGLGTPSGIRAFIVPKH